MSVASYSKELPPGEMILQIISSIRTIDGSVSEIKKGILNKYYTVVAEQLMIERMKRLIETRMQLLYSMFDNKLAFNKYLGETSQITYENLKREIDQR